MWNQKSSKNAFRLGHHEQILGGIWQLQLAWQVLHSWAEMLYLGGSLLLPVGRIAWAWERKYTETAKFEAKGLAGDNYFFCLAWTLEAKILEGCVINPSHILFKSPLKPRIFFLLGSQDFTIGNAKLSRWRPPWPLIEFLAGCCPQRSPGSKQPWVTGNGPLQEPVNAHRLGPVTLLWGPQQVVGPTGLGFLSSKSLHYEDWNLIDTVCMENS